MSNRNQTVAILGASDDHGRYAYLAFKKLQAYGHKAIPVSPKLKTLEGTPAYATLKDIKEPVHTLTMYVGPAISDGLTEEILALKPGRVIFNPGSENPALVQKLRAANIDFEEACTLVLLSTEQF